MVVTIAALYLLPIVPHAITGEVQVLGTPCTYCAPSHPRDTLILPSGVGVRANWTEIHAAPAYFTIIASGSASPVCQGSGATGSCTFISPGGNLTATLTAPTNPTIPVYTVYYSVNYFEPILTPSVSLPGSSLT